MASVSLQNDVGLCLCPHRVAPMAEDTLRLSPGASVMSRETSPLGSVISGTFRS